MRMIDADALKRERFTHLIRFWDGKVLYSKMIDDAPTIDAEPVVRCKDCIYYGDSEYCPALCLADYTNPDDFCCWAERRESDG